MGTLSVASRRWRELPFSLAEAIGILITRSAKIARNLGRVITPEDARRLIKLSHFLRRAAGRLMASPAVLLPGVLSDKGRGAMYEPGSTWGRDDPGIANERYRLRRARSSMVNAGDYRAGLKIKRGKEKETPSPLLAFI